MDNDVTRVICKNIYIYIYSGVSVKFLMVGENNSMMGYHLMAEGEG